MSSVHHRHPLRNAERGFTFIELIIVIVVIGLILGAVLAGDELMRGGGRRAVLSELARYEGAIVTFRDTYNALPGDMTNAAALWGKAAGTGSDAICQNTASTGFATCSGNGDGAIMTSATPLDETYRAWQHLKNAELVEGAFIGTVNGVSMADLTVKVLPVSKRGGIAYQFYSEDKATLGWTNAPEGSTDIAALRAASPVAASGGLPIRSGGNALSAFDVYNIDRKLDDGKPGTGRIFVGYTGSVSCVSNNNAVTATYLSASEQVGCYFHYAFKR